jgi:taurine ABC transporter substrate-binding protein
MRIPAKRSEQPWRAGLAGAACALLTAVAFVTASAGRPQQAQAAALPQVTIGYENNGADPEMVAIARNLFAQDMHANVTLRYFASGPASLAAVASGSLQFMTGIGNPPVVSALAQGVPLDVIWAQELYTTDEGLVVRPSAHIRTLTDLKGHTVALVLGSTSPFELGTALARAHVAASSVHFLNMTPAAMVAAWKRGQIDAAYVWDPAFDEMLQAGGRAIMYDQDVAAEAPIFNLSVVNRTWAKGHQSLVVGFIQAMQAAVAYSRSHPAQATSEMARQAGISVALARTELKGYRIYDLSDQLSPEGLGTGAGVAHSLVTRSLTSAAAYLESTHTISQLPSDLAADVDPAFAEMASQGK